jgi:diguanylate cyclase (GGDEF)-like protein
MTDRTSAVASVGRPAPRVVLVSSAILTVLVVIYAWVFLVPGGGDGWWAQLAGQTAYLVPHLGTVVLAAWVAARASALERRFWAYLSVSSLLLLVWETAYSVRVLLGLPVGWAAFEALSFLPLVAAVLFVIALVLVTRIGESTQVTRLRVMLDITIEFVLAVEIAVMLVMQPLFAVFGAGLGAAALGGVISVMGLFMVGWALLALAGPRSGSMSPAERIVVVGLAVYGTGAILWPAEWIGTITPQYSWLNHWVPILWMIGMCLLTLGSIYRLADDRDAGVLGPDTTRFRPQTSPWTVPLIVAAGVTITVLWSMSAPDASELPTIVGDAIVVLAVLLTARSLLLLIDAERGLLDSMTDPVSGVSTMSAFGVRLTTAIETAGRYGEQVALLVLDIDRFGEINSTRGHKEGDRVLADVGATLRGVTHSGDMVACRTAGDEFAVLVPGLDGGGAYRFAVRTQAEVEATVRRRGIPLSVSIGVALYPMHASDGAALFAVAREALAQAKRDRAGSVLLYDPDRLASDRARALGAPAYLDTIRTFARAVENRTPHVRGHGAGVARLAALLGRRLRLDEQRVRLLEIAGELHDIGFIGVPDRIVEKPGPLDADERAVVQTHPEMAARIIAALDVPEVLPWIRAHHERWDGTGYPRGLAGGEIPLGARVIAVCDAWDAMTSPRPYRGALHRREAIEELGRGRGTQFDPAIVDEFFFILGHETAPLDTMP